MMWGEFAVDPDAIASSFERFVGLVDRFGVDQGRIISDFAAGGRWSRAVIGAAEAAGFGEVKMTSVVERLRELRDEKGVMRLGRTYPNLPGGWIANAAAEDAREPFQAVITEAGGTGCAGDCRAVDMRVDRAPCRVSAYASVPRTAAGIVSVAAPLIQIARSVHLIDPHIGFSERWLRPLSALIGRCRPGTHVTVHLRDSDQASPTVMFVADARNRLAPRLPPGVTVRMLRWKERPGGEPFHDRAVLTDMGGMTFGHGLDEGRAGASVRVQRLDAGGWAAWLATTNPATSPYTLSDDITL
ncbi:hypothetical protein [Sphingomonas sp. CFBP9019]|uniref:hypothetical protein n=1 Tax=Sphingomonas sp. CFBP9019 TaxID=3096532 RepID=UPI002A6AB6B9|nr:hypothetical protein [Sphingomonas sp. CFBP9019]MDY1010329.1 hypothetical protein [Sphingomonas sp. CFBP9019]